MTGPGNSAQTAVKSAATPSPSRRFRKKLRRTSALFFCPRYCEIMIPAAAPTAAITTEYMDANFPASPTPATQVSPSWPIMIWSTILNDDCSMDCSAAGTARWHTVLRHHRTIVSACLAGSFPPILRFEKREIHKVFLRFPNLDLTKNPTPSHLAKLCGDALKNESFFFIAHLPACLPLL